MQCSNRATRTNRVSLFEEDDDPIAYAGPSRQYGDESPSTSGDEQSFPEKSSHQPLEIAVPGPEVPGKGPQFSSQNNTISATENTIHVQENYMTSALETGKTKLSLSAGDGMVVEEKYVAPDPLAILAYLLLKVRERHGTRYNEYLDLHPQDDIASCLVALFRAEAWGVLCSREYTRQR
ncbi:hypothetical protein TWF718_005250 [Orbilia javanica]|uniref:Uncharacterized protein n=1 Tax=Orbilia javanica TaxID=47235 RepID=A0AAN8RIN9_9PEZI